MSSNVPFDSSDHSSEPRLTWIPGQDAYRAAVDSPLWQQWIVPAILFVATFVSTTYAGLYYVYPDEGLMHLMLAVLRHPGSLLYGVPFSFTLMTILLAHELGHYLACRHYGIRCTPPFFIPLPITFAGTLGAFIRIKAPFQHKRALFDVGIAGPLAGFAFVIPALIVGIAKSELMPKSALPGAINFGEPLLFRWVGKLVVGYSPATQDMFAHPIAMAAWFGMLATSLNLLPIWQLDGGHVVYALLGRERQKRFSILATVLLVLISLLGWPVPSYLAYACLVLFFGLRHRFYHPPTLYDDGQIGPGRVILGVIALLILILSFIPIPIYLT